MKACIFDLDGTLTDTLDSLEYSVNETMKQIHMPQITKEQCRDFVGNGAKVLIEKALKAGGDEALDKLDEAMEVYGRVFDENCTYKVVPYKGIERMLETLKKQGIRLAVLSNKPDRQVGDSEVDLATGKAAGMKTILVSWGFRGRKALEEDGADCIVDSVDEILEIMR